ncbi:MAG TPA: DUF4976 domain-containing protein [Candidatus Hydrogenedentes bacterium]|nr:DUF4976 domain-containing protein [Candidatus Hydrogenedentota bacterium]
MHTSSCDRRDFLKLAGLGTAAALSSACPAAAPEKRPNILFIMSDEHNASVLGCSGNDVIRTPHLDALAEGGVVFENCYCNSPLCVPSRMTFTAGKYISRTGAWSNDCWLPSADYPSLPRMLSTAGYEPFLCGKMHYDATRRYGFTEVGQNLNRSVKSGNGKRRKADDLEPLPGLSKRFDDFRPGDTSSILLHDHAVTEGAMSFLRERAKDAKPFFLTVGYLAPHFPLIVPQTYWDAYRGKVAMPVIPEGHLESQVRNYQHLRIAFNMEDVPDDIVRKGRELYYGLTQWVDNEIGKVLKALDESGLAENTIVIYTTDHGEDMGEHGLWWKNCMYECGAHIPLIVHWPARWEGGQRRSGVCSMVDLVQTILELAGAQAPDDWDGDSMLTLLDDGKASWKDQAVSEYYAHNVASGFAMLRAGQYKYVYHTPADEDHGAERELYDLDADPGEFVNLAAEPSQQERIEAMHAALVAEIGESPDDTELRCREDYARGYGRSNLGRKKQV